MLCLPLASHSHLFCAALLLQYVAAFVTGLQGDDPKYLKVALVRSSPPHSDDSIVFAGVKLLVGVGVGMRHF